jgi:hypothetical protein
MRATSAKIYGLNPRWVWKRTRDALVTTPRKLRTYLFPNQPRWYSITVICVSGTIVMVLVGAYLTKLI